MIPLTKKKLEVVEMLKIMPRHPIHHHLQVGYIKFLHGMIFVKGVIILVDVYFIQDFLALPRYSFQTVKWMWYWEVNWSSMPVQLCHTVSSLIEIPDMLCCSQNFNMSTRLVVRSLCLFCFILNY